MVLVVCALTLTIGSCGGGRFFLASAATSGATTGQHGGRQHGDITKQYAQRETHRLPAERAASCVREALIRYSMDIEDAADLIADRHHAGMPVKKNKINHTSLRNNSDRKI